MTNFFGRLLIPLLTIMMGFAESARIPVFGSSDSAALSDGLPTATSFAYYYTSMNPIPFITLPSSTPGGEDVVTVTLSINATCHTPAPRTIADVFGISTITLTSTSGTQATSPLINFDSSFEQQAQNQIAIAQQQEQAQAQAKSQTQTQIQAKSQVQTQAQSQAQARTQLQQWMQSQYSTFQQQQYNVTSQVQQMIEQQIQQIQEMQQQDNIQRLQTQIENVVQQSNSTAVMNQTLSQQWSNMTETQKQWQTSQEQYWQSQLQQIKKSYQAEEEQHRQEIQKQLQQQQQILQQWQTWEQSQETSWQQQYQQLKQYYQAELNKMWQESAQKLSQQARQIQEQVAQQQQTYQAYQQLQQQLQSQMQQNQSMTQKIQQDQMMFQQMQQNQTMSQQMQQNQTISQQMQQNQTTTIQQFEQQQASTNTTWTESQKDSLDAVIRSIALSDDKKSTCQALQVQQNMHYEVSDVIKSLLTGTANPGAIKSPLDHQLAVQSVFNKLYQTVCFRENFAKYQKELETWYADGAWAKRPPPIPPSKMCPSANVVEFSPQAPPWINRLPAWIRAKYFDGVSNQEGQVHLPHVGKSKACCKLSKLRRKGLITEPEYAYMMSLKRSMDRVSLTGFSGTLPNLVRILAGYNPDLMPTNTQISVIPQSITLQPDNMQAPSLPSTPALATLKLEDITWIQAVLAKYK